MRGTIYRPEAASRYGSFNEEPYRFYLYLRRCLLLFVLLCAFWLVFSGIFTLQMLAFGIVSAVFSSLFIVYYLFTDRASASFVLNEPVFFMTLKFFLYLPYIALQMVLSVPHVLRCVLRPEPFTPVLDIAKCDIARDSQRAVIENSITLTPGTIALGSLGAEVAFSAIDSSAASDLKRGKFLRACRFFAK